MRKVLWASVIILAACTVSVGAEAGTMRVGAGLWYSFWDSGIAALNRDLAENSINAEIQDYLRNNPGLPVTGYSADVGVREGTGLSLGNSIGYTTDGGTWDYRLNFMWYGSFGADLRSDITFDYTSGLFGGTAAFDPVFTVNIDYYDIDFRAAGRIMKSLSFFAGYGFQYYSAQCDAGHDFSAAVFTVPTKNSFSFTAAVHMPYCGFTYGHAIMSNVAVTIEGGAGVAVGGMAEQKMVLNGSDHSGDFRINFAYSLFGSLGAVFFPIEGISVSARYRLRRYTLSVSDIDMDLDGKHDSADYSDLFHGFSLSVNYYFPL